MSSAFPAARRVGMIVGLVVGLAPVGWIVATVGLLGATQFAPDAEDTPERRAAQAALATTTAQARADATSTAARWL